MTRDHVRLADGLPGVDRQRLVGVGLATRTPIATNHSRGTAAMASRTRSSRMPRGRSCSRTIRARASAVASVVIGPAAVHAARIRAAPRRSRTASGREARPTARRTRMGRLTIRTAPTDADGAAVEGRRRGRRGRGRGAKPTATAEADGAALDDAVGTAVGSASGCR